MKVHEILLTERENGASRLYAAFAKHREHMDADQIRHMTALLSRYEDANEVDDKVTAAELVAEIDSMLDSHGIARDHEDIKEGLNPGDWVRTRPESRTQLAGVLTRIIGDIAYVRPHNTPNRFVEIKLNNLVGGEEQEETSVPDGNMSGMF